ncbi:exopolysaccharide biosynthesis protein [Kamptonema cortianum]|nr:exopolysaccharide biosynthesis protein [Kamptonema cortianum]MDL5046182.1 exopolysaccharide biosynthesis protein [Oscillatoria amoena NRMC-F 0135]
MTDIPIQSPETNGEKIKLSAQIARLVETFHEKPVTLGEMLSVLQGRTYTLLLIIISLPICTPVPLPGISSAIGLVIAVVGFRLAFGQSPWLPRKLLAVTLPERFFPAFLRGAGRIIRILEHVARPRLFILSRSRVMDSLCGAMICLSGLLLSPPLPIPLTNFFPALTVLLLSMALLEDDGLMVIAGSVVFLLTLAFFTALGYGGASVVAWLHELRQMVPMVPSTP